MATPPSAPPGSLVPPPPLETAEANEQHGHNKLYIWLGTFAFVVMAIFWVVLYVFPHSVIGENPDKISDRAWVVKLESICEPASTYIAQLPNASTAKTATERAHLVDLGTKKLEPMVAALDALPLPSSVSDRKIMTGWMADWKVYLKDRHNFSESLRRDPLAKPLFTEIHGGWSSDSIDAMAQANEIYSCATPQDM